MEAKAELKYIYSTVNDLLKFAEAKHGGLIILNSGLIIGVLSCLTDIEPYIFKPAVILGIICFLASIFLSIKSQFPVVKNTFADKKAIENPNLYFFGHLCCLDAQGFIDELRKIDPTCVIGKMDIDVISQILTISRITDAKFKSFKYATYSAAAGLAIIGISSIAIIILHF